MTLRLILMRHAKSDWDDDEMDDHERPLSKRGRRAAQAIGQWLKDTGHLPDQVLCSSSERTQETWQRVADAGGIRAELVLLEPLYLAAPQTMLDLLRKHGTAQSVMMIGHNPGSGIVAQMLAEAPPEDADFFHYPTGFTTIIDFDVANWGDVDWGKGKVAATMAPRRLESQ